MKTTHKTCKTQEIEAVLDTLHPNYRTVLTRYLLMDQVKQLVNEKIQLSAGLSRELVIYDAVIYLVSCHSHLAPSIWFG